MQPPKRGSEAAVLSLLGVKSANTRHRRVSFDDLLGGGKQPGRYGEVLECTAPCMISGQILPSRSSRRLFGFLLIYINEQRANSISYG